MKKDNYLFLINKKIKDSFFNVILNLIFVIFLLSSYWIEKKLGLIFYEWIFIFFMVIFITLSLITVLFSRNKKFAVIGQVIACSILILINKFSVQDDVAFWVEVPRFEKIISEKSETLADYKIIKLDDYLMMDWEPGFLDYQEVLVYDKDDLLNNFKDDYKMTSDGKLYILKHPKKCFYLCMIYR